MKKTAKLPIRVTEPVRRQRDDRTEVLFPEMSENPWLTKPTKRAVATSKRSMCGLTTLELCAGAGGQALGYEQAGIEHVGLVELDRHACATLRLNRPEWREIVFERDLNSFDGAAFKGADIISGGLPCPPFSVAGKQLGSLDERTCFRP